ncbi:MAG TPA: DUF4349 domain-containing protein [Gaiellaceae bacterium]|nr:DUF4349 domain-containing protein [Gaiellaceae bacterium]
MTASPELLHELRASRPVAPASLRAKTRELATASVARRSVLARLRLPGRRFALVLTPAVVAVALVSAGVVGLTGSGRGEQASTALSRPPVAHGTADSAAPERAPVFGGSTTAQPPGLKTLGPNTTSGSVPGTAAVGGPDPNPGSGGIAPSPNRAQQVEATLTVSVAGSDGVSRAAQDALDLTRSLGGHVVSASVATGEGARAALTVRVPVEKVQQAITGLSALGKIQSQQVSIDDLQESLDSLMHRAASLRSQIVGITAKLNADSLDPVTRAQLEQRRRTLRSELRDVRRSIAGTNAEARFATVQLTVVTSDSLGVVPTSSRLDRTLHGAVNALVWEGVVSLAILVVAAPFLLVGLAAWLGRRLYRRRETERLLAT